VSLDGFSFASNKISLGALGDSFYEYELKLWLLMNRHVAEYRRMYDESVRGMRSFLIKQSKPSGLFFVGELEGSRFSSQQDHLTCFAGGMLALGGYTSPNRAAGAEEIETGVALTRTCATLYRQSPTGIGPEIAVFNTESEATTDYSVTSGRYLLRPGAQAVALKKGIDSLLAPRPETIESIFYMHRITGDPEWAERGWAIFEGIQQYCRTPAAYSGLLDVRERMPRQDNSMQSFFFAETLKYLYLLFR
jgi:hypothetical protein